MNPKWRIFFFWSKSFSSPPLNLKSQTQDNNLCTFSSTSPRSENTPSVSKTQNHGDGAETSDHRPVVAGPPLLRRFDTPGFFSPERFANRLVPVFPRSRLLVPEQNENPWSCLVVFSGSLFLAVSETSDPLAVFEFVGGWGLTLCDHCMRNCSQRHCHCCS